MKRKKIYLYAGYYEMYITDKPMPADYYTLISWHWSVDAAAKNAERLHPGDAYYYKAELFPDDLTYVLDTCVDRNGFIPTSTIGGDEFYII